MSAAIPLLHGWQDTRLDSGFLATNMIELPCIVTYVLSPELWIGQINIAKSLRVLSLFLPQPLVVCVIKWRQLYIPIQTPRNTSGWSTDPEQILTMKTDCHTVVALVALETYLCSANLKGNICFLT